MTVSTRREQNVGYVEIDSPPGNATAPTVRQGFLEAVRWAEHEGLERVIVSVKGGVFAAGTDLQEFGSELDEPHLPDVLNAIEESFVPWIAAIEGVALGGSAELALACRMRIMAPSARIGFPEVTLGVVPGAGGTQRLPRLIGLALALDLITCAKPLGAQAALDAGLIHTIDDEPVFEAFMVNSEELSCRVPAQDLHAPKTDLAVIDTAREKVLENYPGHIAPLRAINVIEEGLGLSFHSGLALERQTFLELQDCDQAKALRHIYFAEMAAKAALHNSAGVSKATPVSVVSDDDVGHRILARYHEAADTLLIDGSTPWEIDEAMVEFGYVMGPYAAQDLSGLDIAHADRRLQDATRDPARRYIPIADRMVELGKLGRKTGAGWYRYPGGGGRVEDPIVADLGIEEAHFAGITRVDYKEDEIRRRLLLAMINEAADLLHEGIAQNAHDIDLVTVFGYGFPRWRGGLMHYADSIGAQSIVAQLEQLCEEDPVAWKTSPLLRHCATAGSLIADVQPEHLPH